MLQNGSDGFPANVQACFDTGGGLTPLAFRWRGLRLRLHPEGAPAQRARGAELRQHFLVTAAGETMFELTFAPAKLRWQAARAGRREIWV